MPAIAIGMEPAEKDLLSQPPRDPREGILTKDFMVKVLFQGLLIAVCSMTAFHIGLRSAGAACASTMAFATLTAARLFHGFNCRSRHSIFKIGFSRNWYSLGAFAAGILLLALVLFLTPLHSMFEVVPLTGSHLGIVLILAAIPTVFIQAGKMISDAAK